LIFRYLPRQITELLHSSLTFSRPLLSSLPPSELPSTSTGATPPLFTAVAALSKTLYGFISWFSSRSFPSVVELILSRGQGNGRRDALGYQDEVVVKRFKLGESVQRLNPLTSALTDSMFSLIVQMSMR
jgi:hypothetical protein